MAVLQLMSLVIRPPRISIPREEEENIGDAAGKDTRRTKNASAQWSNHESFEH